MGFNKLGFVFLNSRLGHKIEGVLCDGQSNEVVASTVVNCLKIDEGKLIINRSHVIAMFIALFTLMPYVYAYFQELSVFYVKVVCLH